MRRSTRTNPRKLSRSALSVLRERLARCRTLEHVEAPGAELAAAERELEEAIPAAIKALCLVDVAEGDARQKLARLLGAKVWSP